MYLTSRDSPMKARKQTFFLDKRPLPWVSAEGGRGAYQGVAVWKRIETERRQSRRDVPAGVEDRDAGLRDYNGDTFSSPGSTLRRTAGGRRRPSRVGPRASCLRPSGGRG